MYTNFNALPDHSRIWVYQSNRELSEKEVFTLENGLREFVNSWTAHEKNLRASFKVAHSRFIVLAVDENVENPSGCSIDKAMNFMKVVENEFGVDLFDRMSFTYLDGEEVKIANKKLFQELLEKGVINDDTLVFNNLLKTVGEFKSSWTIPYKNSWHKNLFLSPRAI